MTAPTIYGISWPGTQTLVVIGSLEEAEAHARAAVGEGDACEIVKVVVVSTYTPKVAS